VLGLGYGDGDPPGRWAAALRMRRFGEAWVSLSGDCTSPISNAGRPRVGPDLLAMFSPPATQTEKLPVASRAI